MNEKTGIRKKLERSLSQKLPELVWNNRVLQELVDEYLGARDDADREGAWSVLVEVAEDRMRLVEEAKAEALEGVQANTLGGQEVVRGAVPRGRERTGGTLEAASFAGPKTTAMLRAMSELFAGLAHQYPEVVWFRDKVLEGRFLTDDEVQNLLASHAAWFFRPEWFSRWDIPVIGHTSKLLEYDPGKKYKINHRATVWVDPPGIPKRVRYTHPHTPPLPAGRMPIKVVPGKDLYYPPFLWPGSVVHILYDLAERLSDQFDWPNGDAATWFILTGKAPEVRPIDARWETKKGKYFNPQWRIQLTIPPWLPEKEVLRAYRRMRRQILGDTALPKTTTPLEVARFVWERERLNGYRRPFWPALLEQWNEEHPGARFKTYNNFRTYFMRGDKAVKVLNFSWPQPDEEDPPDE